MVNVGKCSKNMEPLGYKHMNGVITYNFGLLPTQDAIVTNEGLNLGWDSLHPKNGMFQVVTVTGWGGSSNV